MERMDRMQRTAWAESAMEAMHVRAAERHAAAGTDAAGTMDRMKSEVHAMRARLADTAPRKVMVEMDKAISVLHRRVQDLSRNRDGVGMEAVSLLAGELSEMRTALDDLRAPGRLKALSAGIEVLSRKIDVMDAKAVSPVEVARLQAQSAELAELVRRAMSGGNLQALAERLAACSAQVSRAGDEAARKVEAATAAFEHQAEALLARMDRMGEATQAEQGAATRDLHRDMATGMADLHARLDALSQQLGGLSPATGSELAVQLSALAARLDTLNDTDKAIAAPLSSVVERHLLQLTERFQAAHARLSRLDDIETGINHILDQLQHARIASAEATAEAVQAVALKVSSADDGPAVVGLKRGLAALEARQNEVERSASAWLGEPFHDTALELDRKDDGVWAPPPNEHHQNDLHDGDEAQPYAVHEEAALHDHPVQDAPRDHDGYEPAYHMPEPEPEPEFDAQPEPLHTRPQATRRVEPRWTQDPVEHDFAEAAINPGIAGMDASAPSDASLADAPDVRHAPHYGERMSAFERGEERNGADVLRPRVMKGKPKPSVRRNAGKVSWKAVAASVAVVAIVTSAGFAWVKRDAIAGHVTAMAPAAPAPVQAAISTGSLPAPAGSAALQADAKAGDIAAAYEVGVRYAEGNGVAQDLDAAVKWLGYAVSKGSPQAAYRLGSLYENNIQNMAEARRFYKWAAEQGNVQAMHNLAVLYAQDVDGSDKNWEQAIAWFRRAASYGKRDSQHNLGIIYARGLSGSSDLKEALAWFSIAARQGDKDSSEKRDALLRQADAQVKADANRIVDAFRARPFNEDANTIAAKPEWNVDDGSGQMAAENGVTVTGPLTMEEASAQMFSAQPLTSQGMLGQKVASRR